MSGHGRARERSRNASARGRSRNTSARRRGMQSNNRDTSKVWRIDNRPESTITYEKDFENNVSTQCERRYYISAAGSVEMHSKAEDLPYTRGGILVLFMKDVSSGPTENEERSGLC